MSDKEDEFFAIIRNGFQSIVTELDAYLSKKVEVAEQVVKQSYDLEKIQGWTVKNGKQGQFELAKEQVTPDYQALKADLINKGHGFYVGPYWVWLFPDKTAVGRKIPAKKAKA